MLGEPIVASEGDVLGLYTPPGSTATCYFEGPGVPAADSLNGGTLTSTPTTGASIVKPSYGPSPPGYVLNVAASLVGGEADLGVSTTAAPTDATAGQLASFSSTITNAGPAGAPKVTFTDTLPAGVSVQQAVAGRGICTVGSGSVTCTVPSLEAEESVPVVITVVPSAAGSYTNRVSASSAAPDANPANNNAEATLTVAAAPTTGSSTSTTTTTPPPTPTPAPSPTPRPQPTPMCVVPKLRGASLHEAKRILKLLGCKIGRLKVVHARRIHVRHVIGTGPGVGTYPTRRHISIVISSGPRRHRHAHHAGHGGHRHSHRKRRG